MISKKKKIFQENLPEFKKESSTKTLYNLPAKVEFCKTCLMSNQKPAQTVEHRSSEKDHKLTIEFIDGVCHACRYRKTKEQANILRYSLYKLLFFIFLTRNLCHNLLLLVKLTYLKNK